MGQTEINWGDEVLLGNEGDEEDTAGLGSKENDLRGCGGGVGAVGFGPVRDEDVTDATTAEDLDRKAIVCMEDVRGDIGGDIARPALMAVERGETGEDGVLVGHAEGVCADVKGGHGEAAGGEVVDDGEDVRGVEVEVNYAKEDAEVGGETLQKAEDGAIGDGKGL